MLKLHDTVLIWVAKTLACQTKKLNKRNVTFHIKVLIGQAAF